MGVLIAIIIVGFIIYGVIAGIKLKKLHDAENATFMGEHRGWDIYTSPHGRGVLALDHDEKRVVVGKVTDYFEHPWSDINGVEIEKNGQSIQQTNRGSQVMGAAVGALLLGPVGLLMGGVTGSKRQRERVNELSLKVMIDNREAPLHRIVFFQVKGSGVDAQSRLLKEPARKMEHFHALLSNAVRHDHRATFAPGMQQSAIEGPEDRIAKLWDLRQAGALSEEEFAAQKLAILTPARNARVRSRLSER
jgi:hypothetical protein